MELSSYLVVALALAVPLLLVGLQLRSRKRRQRNAVAKLERARGLPARMPLTLYPRINPDLCIGSLTCLSSCPEGDILGVVDGVARLMSPDHCIGHGRCAAQCPVNAITLVFGTEERGVQLPQLDTWFESSRPGVHIVGELGGMGLIKNAVTQGLQVAKRLATTLKPGAGKAAIASRAAGATVDGAAMVDVAVVGAGPAGLATALGLRAAGKTLRVLDQEVAGGTIAHYPRQKVVMTEPVQLPYFGKLKGKVLTKELLLSAWSEALDKASIQVEQGVRVTGLEGHDGAFQLQTSAGPVSARKVVLAIGRRGTPRKLKVPGEDLDKVTYRMVDAEQYDGCRVLVVGGGDSALEAAIQLAEISSAEVSISYRSESFGRCREANRARIGALIESGKITALFNSEVQNITAAEVVLDVAGTPRILGNDFVVVSIGGELPLEFLDKTGVKLDHHFGETRRAPQPVEVEGPTGRAGLALERERDAHRRRQNLFYAVLGLLIIGWLSSVGWHYYLLSPLERLRSPEHQALRPAGTWGHWVGICATGFMLSNFLYPVRKRWKRLSRLGAIREWLDFHTFVGFMSPLVICFHAAFQSNNGLATATSAALLIVVLTGIIGRFIYGLVPAGGGKTVELSYLRDRWEQFKSRLEPMVMESDDPALLRELAADAVAPAQGGSLLLLFARMPFEAARTQARLLRARFHFDGAEGYESYKSFRDTYLRLRRLRTQVGFYQALKRLLRTWRVFHASLASFLVVAMSAHIAVSLYLGYGWRR